MIDFQMQKELAKICQKYTGCKTWPGGGINLGKIHINRDEMGSFGL